MSAIPDWFTHSLPEWPPLWQAATIFGATFILEDVAAVGAGLLLGAGAINWPVAFWACFLGIWGGDAGLYALARGFGRPAFERSWFKRFQSRVERSERWFDEHGNAILVFSRLLPGARLPTYVAAGFLRLPLSRFLLITGTASCLWTVIVLLLTHWIGARLVSWFAAFNRLGWAVLGCAVLLLAGLHFLRTWLGHCRLRELVVRWRRCGRWEFWPPAVFYAPVVLQYLWLGLKHRGLMLPTAANPGIFAGGIVGESKMATLNELAATSPEFVAAAGLLKPGAAEDRLSAFRDLCARLDLTFPVILKPDVGQRGVGLKLVQDDEQVLAYLRQTSAPLVVQRFIPGPEEIGVFYYRFPTEDHGHIFAITEKAFPVIVGNGQSTIEELVWADPRARFLADKYLARLRRRAAEVLPAGQRLKLVEAGNHAQGCIFRDGMHLLTPALAERIDGISRQLPGFFIGRYDIRYAAQEALQAGRDFWIIELNGATSEATSIYDARNSLGQAYRTLYRQWDLVFAIGAANCRRGARTTSLRTIWREWRRYCQWAAEYPTAD